MPPQTTTWKRGHFVDLIPNADLERGLAVALDRHGLPLCKGDDPLRVKAFMMHPETLAALRSELGAEVELSS